MKKIFYIISFNLMMIGGITAQGDITVEGPSNVLNTVSIGNNFSSDHEFFVNSTLGSNFTFVDLIASSQTLAHSANSAGGNYNFMTSSDVTFRTNNITHARLLSTNGFFGVGTGSPDATLHVSQGGSSGTTNPVMFLESVTSKLPILQFSEGGALTSNGMSFMFDGRPQNIGNMLHIMKLNGTPLATWSLVGGMGINITGTPNSALEVNGNIGIQGAQDLFFMEGAVQKAKLEAISNSIFLENMETNGDIIIKSAQSDVILDALTDDVAISTDDDIAFRIDGDNKMFLDQDGELGINKTTSNAMIDIKQLNGNEGLMLENNGNTDDWAYEIGGNDLRLQFNGSLVGSFDDVLGTYMPNSDRRLKNDIQPLENGVLDKLMQLRPCTYFFKDQETNAKKEVGFIAQEVLEIFPSLISGRQNLSEEEYLGISYDLVNVIAIKALQEQNTQKVEIQSQLDELENLEEQLLETEALISSLFKQLSILESK